MTAKPDRLLDSGDKSPDWTLESAGGETVSSGDFLGREDVVLFFYPKASTGG